MKTFTTSVLVVLVTFWACGPGESSGPPDEILGHLQARLSVAGEPTDDVVGVLFSVLDDQGQVVASRMEALEEETLPPDLAQDGGTKHRFADGLFVLPAGQYTVVATPMRSETEPSKVCDQAHDEVVILPGVVLEIVLVMQCEGEDASGVDIVAILNHKPLITNLEIAPSKFVLQCEEATITVTAEDPDGDPITFEFSVVEAPEAAEFTFEPESNVARFQSETAGNFSLHVTVSDAHGAKTSLKFPLHVSLDDKDADGVGDLCGCQEGETCDDGNACTTGDICHDKVCQGSPLSCDDGNPCTTDACEPAEGCVHESSEGVCEDGNLCTTGDQCAGGACMPGAPVDCDDGDPCTRDSCDPVTGCVHAFDPDAFRPPTGSSEPTRTPWQMHQGLEVTPDNPLGLVKFTCAPSRHGDICEYNDANIPPAEDPGWGPAPDGEIIDLNLPCGQSRVCQAPIRCMAYGDFTYFQTFVNIPAPVEVTTFTITFHGMDDGSRVTIFNSEYPEGFVIPGSYVYLGGSGTTNLASYVVSGEVNRVVITQVDDCCCENYLREARVVLNGQEVPARCGG